MVCTYSGKNLSSKCSSANLSLPMPSKIELTHLIACCKIIFFSEFLHLQATMILITKEKHREYLKQYARLCNNKTKYFTSTSKLFTNTLKLDWLQVSSL